MTTGNTDTTFLAELWALDRTRELALEIADRSRAEYEATHTTKENQMPEKLVWKKIQMMGWVKYEGQSENRGPYTIEEGDTASYFTWCGDIPELIGEASSIPKAKKLAQDHCDNL